jgi:hypothetical protein
MFQFRQRRGLRPVLAVTVASIALILTALAGPAAAAASVIVVSPSTVAAGGTVTVSGVIATSGTPSCAPGDAAIITSTVGLFPRGGLGPQAARSVTGAFRVSYMVPISTPPGIYVVGFRCGGGNVGVTAALRVVAQVQQVPVGAPQAGLGGASAGGNATGWFGAAAVCAAIALLLVGLSLRRRRIHATR